jgi:hypothetical protein
MAERLSARELEIGLAAAAEAVPADVVNPPP